MISSVTDPSSSTTCQTAVYAVTTIFHQTWDVLAALPAAHYAGEHPAVVGSGPGAHWRHNLDHVWALLERVATTEEERVETEERERVATSGDISAPELINYEHRERVPQSRPIKPQLRMVCRKR